MNIVLAFDTLNEIVHTVCWEEEPGLRVMMWTLQSDGVKSGLLSGIKTLADAQRLLDHEYNAAIFVEVDTPEHAVDLLAKRMPSETGPAPRPTPTGSP